MENIFIDLSCEVEEMFKKFTEGTEECFYFHDIPNE